MIDIHATYSGVTYWQIATGYILAAILFVGLALLFWWIHRLNMEILRLDTELKVSESINESAYNHSVGTDKQNDSLIDKVKSLEATITRLTVRPRGKNGRFMRKSEGLKNISLSLCGSTKMELSLIHKEAKNA